MKCAPGFDMLSSFAALAADDDDVSVVTVQCMNQCKRGPVARIVADGQVQIVAKRMNELEQKRKSFQAVGPAKVAPIWDVVTAIADGSLRDGFGEFEASDSGPLPPSAQ